MGNVQKSVKKDKKKHFKASIVLLSVFLALVLGGIFAISSIMLNIHSDSLYPENVLVKSDISAFSRTMDTNYYMPLKDIAISIAQEGAGPMLLSINRSKDFDYEGDVLTSLSTSTGSGRIIVRQGSGNIQSDITESTPYYYEFMGKIKPVYKEKKIESGQLNNFYTEYSAGYVETGNLIKQNGYYVAALECSVSENGRYLFVVYATESLKELRNQIGLMKDFAILALKGDTGEHISQNDASEEPAEAVEKEDDIDMTEYFEQHKVEEAQRVPVSALTQVSGNDTGATDNKVQEDETIDLQIEP